VYALPRCGVTVGDCAGVVGKPPPPIPARFGCAPPDQVVAPAGTPTHWAGAAYSCLVERDYPAAVVTSTRRRIS
jgi:hypothetical protein